MAADVSSIGSSIGTYRLTSRASSPNGGGRSASAGGDQQDGSGTAQAGSASGAQTNPLQQSVQKLKQTDANVRKHEAAHQAAGGGHAGAASFTFTRGPDGKSYATAGEVQVDISAEAQPAATIAKMEQVKAAALAPDDPSPQDLRVAAQADALKLQAQAELRKANGGGTGGDTGGQTGGDAGGVGGDRSAASPALSARGVAAYGAAQTLGVPTLFGAARGVGVGLVV